jgi:D-3-phosphoglycerate dehydrogenase
MKNLLLLNSPHPILANLLRQEGFTIDVDLESDEQELLAKLPHYFGLVLRSRVNVTREMIDAGTKLAFIAREGIGLEHIEVDYARQKGIEVINSPEGSRDTVGEHALGMLLGLLNHLNRADQEIRKGAWLREPNRGVEIKGKTVGIIGYGNTGQAFAQRLQGFEAEVLAYDKYRSNYGNAHAREASLEELFERADIVSMHIWYDKANHYFVNRTFLERFQKPIYLVNTSRGLVLETAALVEAMQERRVVGAALDVLEYEESSFEQLSLNELPAPFQFLIQSDRTLLSPHIAGWSFASKERHAKVLAEKIIQTFCRQKSN